MTYQKATGCLTAKMCEGYCGQDAYNDMFVTETQNDFMGWNRSVFNIDKQKLWGGRECQTNLISMLW